MAIQETSGTWITNPILRGLNPYPPKARLGQIVVAGIAHLKICSDIRSGTIRIRI